jgi:hypothetical protein
VSPRKVRSFEESIEADSDSMNSSMEMAFPGAFGGTMILAR